MAKKKITEYFFITMGIILVAISVEYFFIPNNLAAGGVYLGWYAEGNLLLMTGV